MSIESSDEEEEITLLEASRAKHSPPRKKRKLNNRRSKKDESEEGSSTDSDNDEEEKDISDKENNHTRTKRRASTQNAVYRFGKQTFTEPVIASPGAIVRIELINFLCHSNFEMAFHPNINIIYGQNGSGKSAVECGISMGLGISAKKSQRGNNIKDIIKFGTNFARIRIFLYNQGVEALKEYGPQIIIERRLTKNGKNGTSSFKILDSNFKTISTQFKVIRGITDKLNINVNNPCVVLKQSVAKQFLNSTKNSDKFKFFMGASKLGDFEHEIQEAKNNVDEARDDQKRTKNAFGVIKSQYIACKLKHDQLVNMESLKEKVELYTKHEKWCKYGAATKNLNEAIKKVTKSENRINSGKKQFAERKAKLTANLEKAKARHQQVQDLQNSNDEFRTPINEIRTENVKLEKQRRDVATKINAKTRFIDTINRETKKLKREYQNVMSQMQNNENQRKLAQCTQQLNDEMVKLEDARSKLPEIEQRGGNEPTIEMKQNRQKLNELNQQIKNIGYKKEGIQRDLHQLQSKDQNRSEMFCPEVARSKRISVGHINSEIQRHRRQFSTPPIGPLGEYIIMNDDQDRTIFNKKMAAVQYTLGPTMRMYLCATSQDQVILKKIINRKFGIILPTICFRSDRDRFTPNPNPYEHYKPNDRDGPLYRISDLFTIRDNNPWVYNALLVQTNFERVYTHGTLGCARSFLQRLDQHKLKSTNYILTFQEKNRVYKVARRGHSVSATPLGAEAPLLISDQSQLKAYYTEQLNSIQKEMHSISNSLSMLQGIVNNEQNEFNRHQRQYKKHLNLIKKLENNVNSYSRDKSDLEEDENDSSELQERLDEITNNIKDNESNLNSIDSEIEPYKIQQRDILNSIAERKQKLNKIEHDLQDKVEEFETERNKYQEFLDRLKMEGKKLKAVGSKIPEMENQLKILQNQKNNEENRCNKLKEVAEAAGDEPPAPTKQKGRYLVKMSIKEVISDKRRIEASVEEWENNSNDPDEIRRAFNVIKPKYETHEERVRNTNHNVDEMLQLIFHRKKNYNKMKEYVRDSLCKEFRYVMRQQGHDGTLVVDYDEQELVMNVHMSSHDGSTQVRNSKTLSGGERSFTQVALIMALQKFCGSPFCIYDEFDVFMDSVNRGNSIKILITAALGPVASQENNKNNKNKNKSHYQDQRQYIFITPNDVSPIIAEGHSNLIKIMKLQPPRPNTQ